MAGLHGGYGRFQFEGRRWPAHLLLYTTLIGPVAPGLEPDHLCRNPACVNHAHLEPVTHQQNVLRGESPIAQEARAEACPQGHPYDQANTYMWRGSRAC